MSRTGEKRWRTSDANAFVKYEVSENFEQLGLNLAVLEDALYKKIMRKAMRAPSQKGKRVMKSNVPTELAKKRKEYTKRGGTELQLKGARGNTSGTAKEVKGTTLQILKKSIAVKIQSYRKQRITFAAIGPKNNVYAWNGERIWQIALGIEKGWKGRTPVQWMAKSRSDIAKFFFKDVADEIGPALEKESQNINNKTKPKK